MTYTYVYIEEHIASSHLYIMWQPQSCQANATARVDSFPHC